MTAPEVIPGWTGTGTGTAPALNRPLPAQSKDTYTIVVGATVPADLAPETLACSAAGAGHGYFNSATLTSGSDQFKADACDSIAPTPPTLAAAVSPAAPAPAAPPPSAPLAITGLMLSLDALAAAALFGVGGALVFVSRRPRRRYHPAHKGRKAL